MARILDLNPTWHRGLGMEDGEDLEVEVGGPLKRKDARYRLPA